MADAPGSALSVAALRLELAASRQALCDAFLVDLRTKTLLSRHSRLVDRALSTLWAASGIGNRAALIAVGGYGRGELYPYSDVDVLVLVPTDSNADVKARLEMLIGQLWDIGLEVGHSIRTLDECFENAAQDITIQTNLIEARRIAGDPTLSRGLEVGVRQRLDPQSVLTPRRSLNLNNATPSIRTPRIASNPTARRVRAVCAICR